MNAEATRAGRRTSRRTSWRTDWRTSWHTGWRTGLPALVDTGFLLGLSIVALVGLGPTFSGVGYLVVSIAGLLVGVAIAAAARLLRLPAMAAALVGLLALVLGGMVVSATSFGTVVDQVQVGWKDLLTTLPPVDATGPVLVLPWLLGLVAGLLGGLLSRPGAGPPTARAALPLVAPVALLAAVILLGVTRPQSLWIQGVAFAGLAVGWLAVRVGRTQTPVRGGSGRARRAVSSALLVVGAGVLALPIANWATWATGDDGGRVVLRTQVQPPFDIGQYPSPLASFRRYVEEPDPVDAENLYDRTLLTVSGAPAGARLRIAALDFYDGTVWGATENAAGSGIEGPDDTFQRVSREIDNPVQGSPVDVTITVGEGYDAVWLPTIGALQSLDFDDGDVEAKRETFRYNLASATAVVPSGVHPGDVYAFTGVQPDQDVEATDTPSDDVSDAAFAATFLDTQARQWSAGASAPMERVFAIAEHLKTEGKYSDGVLAAERIYHPGHHVKRLSDEFANAPIMVGNDEQYAAIMALLANKAGVPARVVLGAVVPTDGVVRGKDVQAWVELQVADGSWRTLPTETFMDTDRPAEQPPLSEEELSGTVVPPPAPIPPPSTLADQNDAELEARKINRKDDDAGPLTQVAGYLLLYVGGPLLVMLLVVGSILAVKALRRRRRRRATRTSSRIVGGWRELVDHARDLGQPVSVGATATRREQSRELVSAGAPDLAVRADRHVFGPAAPDGADVEAFWAAVDLERRELSRAVTRLRRLRGALSLRSFRRR